MNDLIVFAEDFGSLPSSTQHIVKQLAKQRKVLWVNSIGLRKPRLSKQDFARVLNKLLFKPKANYSQPTTDNNKLRIVNIKTIPAPKYQWERDIAKFLMLKQLKPLISSFNMHKPILWLSLPTAVDLCSEFDESAVVYYCGDDFGALAGVDHATVLEHEKKLAQKADLILVASEALLDKFPTNKTHLLRHAVNTELFFTPMARAFDLPQGKPIVGFYGSLSEWLDAEFIYQVAAAKQDWNFVFIGPMITPFPALIKLANVHFLGPRAHDQLPSYSQHWNMCWLPFKNNAQIKACSPLKLMEYIASARPIAATKFDALKAYQDQINIVNDSNEMIDLLDKKQKWILADPSKVAKDTWQARADLVNGLLCQIKQEQRGAQ